MTPTEQEKIVYECSFGMEAYGKVIETDEGDFQCYEIPLFGGEWQKVGNAFNTRSEAISFLNSLT